MISWLDTTLLYSPFSSASFAFGFFFVLVLVVVIVDVSPFFSLPILFFRLVQRTSNDNVFDWFIWNDVVALKMDGDDCSRLG